MSRGRVSRPCQVHRRVQPHLNQEMRVHDTFDDLASNILESLPGTRPGPAPSVPKERGQAAGAGEPGRGPRQGRVRGRIDRLLGPDRLCSARHVIPRDTRNGIYNVGDDVEGNLSGPPHHVILFG